MRLTFAVCLLLGLLAHGGVAADDGGTPGGPKPAAPKDESAKAAAAREAAAAKAKADRMAALKSRAQEWYDARTKMVLMHCPKCRGFGGGSDRMGGWVSCPKCEGRKTVLAVAPFRKVHYDMKSEAWRRRSTAQDEANQAYIAANTSLRVPLFLRKFQIERVECVGETFGEVWVVEGTDSVSRPSRWIAVTTPGTKRETWFVYSEETDGPWGESTETEPRARDLSSEGEPLKQEEAASLHVKIALAKASHVFDSGRWDKETLVVSVFDPKPKTGEALDESIARDTVPLTRAALEAVPVAKRARVVFLAIWRDKFGAIAKKAYRSAEISRGDFDKIHFDTLPVADQLALWEFNNARRPDETLWWKAEKPPEADDPEK